ncbi:MAG: DUF302 domain-containing protein [Neomegalonema sp.]|nr:DUF302 domain-containing protein [Neomegalonema sp.]
MRLIRALIAAVALVAAPALVPSAFAEPTVGARKGWVVIETKMGFAELSKRLDKAIKAAKMGKVTQASATIGAKRLGKTIPGNKVVGVYRPDFAIRMLKASVAAGVEAPIRFYITEEKDGSATLSYKTPTTVFTPYFDEGGADLRKLAAQLDSIFNGIAKNATQ